MDNGEASYRRFLEGDDYGLVEIIRDYKDGLILYICGIVGNITAAEELMEDVFVKLAVRKPKFKGKSSFKTWLYAVGRNAAIDYTRRQSRMNSVPIEECDDLLSDERSLEAAYIREERRITVHRMLVRLKPDYRQSLYLVFFEDFSVKEAARIMKKGRHQMENLIYRAKLSLKHELEKEGFVYEEL